MAVKVTLPDGSVKEYPDGTNALQVAESISKGLAKVVVAAKVNGEIWDFHRALPSKCTLLLIKEDQPEGLDVIRHSAAHIMAGAVRRIYGDQVKFGSRWLALEQYLKRKAVRSSHTRVVSRAIPLRTSS